MNNSKPCTWCKEIKSLHDFNKDRTKRDGLQSQCRICKRAGQKRDYLKKIPTYMERQRKRREKHPERRRVYDAVRRAIMRGDLIRPDACSSCGDSELRIEAHHHKGYSPEFALDVVFPCTRCHREADKMMGKRPCQAPESS